MLPPLKKKTLIGLKKAQSLIGKMIDMVEHDEYCVSIMQQNMAVTGLLKAAQQELMESHLKSCFSTAMKENGSAKSNEKKEKMIDEILTVTKWKNK